MKYEDISIGDRVALKKTVTAEMVREFAEFSGDFNPVHMEEDFCRSHGLGSRVAHGMLVLSFLSALIGMHLPGEGALWMSHNIEFLTPVKIDDTVEITGEVTGKSDAGALGLKILTLKVRIKNQLGRLVAKGFVKVAMK